MAAHEAHYRRDITRATYLGVEYAPWPAAIGYVDELVAAGSRSTIRGSSLPNTSIHYQVVHGLPAKYSQLTTQIDVVSNNQLVSQFTTIDYLHGTPAPRSAFFHGIDVSAGRPGQLGPGFYVTPDRTIAEWFALHRGSSNTDGRILHLPLPESTLSELKILKLTSESSEFRRLDAAWRQSLEVPSDLQYVIDDFDAIEAPIRLRDSTESVQLKFTPSAHWPIDRQPIYSDDVK